MSAVPFKHINNGSWHVVGVVDVYGFCDERERWLFCEGRLLGADRDRGRHSQQVGTAALDSAGA